MKMGMCPDPTHPCRNQRQKHHDDHCDAEMPLNEGNIPERVADAARKRHPQDSADDVVSEERRIFHVACSRNKRREGPDHRQITRDDNRLAAVTIVEFARFIQVFLFQKPQIPLLNLFAKRMADGVIQGIPKDRRPHEQRQKDRHAQHSARRKGTRDKQEGIAGEKGDDHEPRLAEDDQKENEIRRGSVVRVHGGEMHVQVQEEIDDTQVERHGFVTVRNELL